MSGVERIAAERERQQKVEGWDSVGDDAHVLCEMAWAAGCYLEAAQIVAIGGLPFEGVPADWPWADPWWKPSDDPVRMLTKAGALIAAEIDRLTRLATTKEGE